MLNSAKRQKFQTERFSLCVCVCVCVCVLVGTGDTTFNSYIEVRLSMGPPLASGAGMSSGLKVTVIDLEDLMI